MKTAIIIPTYNRPEYLLKCLESLKKTYLKKDTLIFIIDDGSDNTTKSIIKNFNKEGCFIEKIFKGDNLGIYNSLLIAYDYCFNLNVISYDYVILLGSDMIVNNYFYDMMVYYKHLFPNNIISGFNTLTLSELGTPRHPVVYNGNFYVEKKTSGSACTGIDKKIYENYIYPTLIEQQKKNKLCYDTISSQKAFNDGHGVICTVPSVAEHIGITSTLGHRNNPDISIDFKEYVELGDKL